MRGERSFLGSTSKDRKKSIGENLHLSSHLKEILRGKIITIIDDSTVRANNARRTRELSYNEAEVRKAYHVNYTPPIGIVGRDGIPRGCMFGVDMPPNDNFIARGRTPGEISKKIKMPIVYISLAGMLRAYERLGVPKENLCIYCIGGKHPLRTP